MSTRRQICQEGWSAPYSGGGWGGLQRRRCVGGGQGRWMKRIAVRLGRGKQTGRGDGMNRPRCYPCGNGPHWYWRWPLRLCSGTSAGCFSFFPWNYLLILRLSFKEHGRVGGSGGSSGSVLFFPQEIQNKRKKEEHCFFFLIKWSCISGFMSDQGCCLYSLK